MGMFIFLLHALRTWSLWTLMKVENWSDNWIALSVSLELWLACSHRFYELQNLQTQNVIWPQYLTKAYVRLLVYMLAQYSRGQCKDMLTIGAEMRSWLSGRLSPSYWSCERAAPHGSVARSAHTILQYPEVTTTPWRSKWWLTSQNHSLRHQHLQCGTYDKIHCVVLELLDWATATSVPVNIGDSLGAHSECLIKKPSTNSAVKTFSPE